MNIKKTNLIAWTGIGIVLLVICFWMAGKIDHKLTFIVDGLELSNRTSLAVGRNSDIAYHRVPQDYLIITREGERFTWKVNERYHRSDSLQYFKINDVNPNSHTIRNDANQRITLKLPTGNDTIEFTVTGADVWKTWNAEFKSQHDILARHFAAFFALHGGEATHDDSLRYLGQMQQHAVRSFFHRANDQIKMVILDRHTVIRDNTNGRDTVIRYAFQDTARADGEFARRCKVQFFAVSSHCYLDNSPDESTFRIDGVNYVMKASVRLTEWGAGHVMIDAAKDNNLNVSFPKPVTFVGSVDSLRKRSQQSSGIITLKQSNNSFPNKSDLYLPAFSSAINYDLCGMEFYHNSSDSAVVIRDANCREFVVGNAGGLATFIPAFNHYSLKSGNSVLQTRIGFIGMRFYLSYLCLPLLVFVFIMLMIWLPKSPLNQPRNYVPHVRHYRGYLTLLLAIGMAYCACKSLVALKLSYTYPYFEKLTGIAPAASAMILLLSFTIAMLLSISLLNQRKKWWSVAMIVGCAFVTMLVAGVFFKFMDSHISAGVIGSYFRSQVFCWPWNWTGDNAVGINDTHRSVVYTLLLVEGVLLVIWGALLVPWSTLLSRFMPGTARLLPATRDGLMRRCSTAWRRISREVADKWNGFCSQRVVRRLCASHRDRAGVLLFAVVAFVLLLVASWTGMVAISMKYLLLGVVLLGALFFFVGFLRSAFIGAIKCLVPWHVIALLVLVVIGVMPGLGNFSTAFITLIVIVGLSHALSSTAMELEREDSRPRHTILAQMFVITVIYTMAAIIADNGYITNFVGFVLFIFALFYLSRRSYDAERLRNEKRWVRGTVVVIGLCALLLPFVCSHLVDPENVNYSRMNRRVILYADFDNARHSGYRYSESDAEFMVIMSHYMQGDSLARRTSDPLSNDAHFIHPSVSSAQSPVAINDLSLPIAFFGSYGSLLTHLVFFGLLALLLWVVLRHTLLVFPTQGDRVLSRFVQWRLLALFMWVGTSLYIFASYIDWMPFTGRLIPGFGVDAVGEALEVSVLLGFMASVTMRKNEG